MHMVTMVTGDCAIARMCVRECARSLVRTVARRLVSCTAEHGQRRVSREPWIRLRQLAHDEPAAFVAHDDATVQARRAEAGRSIRSFGLNAIGSIVHDRRMFTSETVTRGIRVSVMCEYAPDRSNPAQGQWFFLYTITISNEGTETAQLISRHWIITDGTGRIEEVRGPGVVGKQPILDPGESFTYTSGCPLKTSFGTMQGTYQMATRAGEHFDAIIAPFALSEPYTVH